MNGTVKSANQAHGLLPVVSLRPYRLTEKQKSKKKLEKKSGTPIQNNKQNVEDIRGSKGVPFRIKESLFQKKDAYPPLDFLTNGTPSLPLNRTGL